MANLKVGDEHHDMHRHNSSDHRGKRRRSCAVGSCGHPRGSRGYCMDHWVQYIGSEGASNKSDEPNNLTTGTAPEPQSDRAASNEKESTSPPSLPDQKFTPTCAEDVLKLPPDLPEPEGLDELSKNHRILWSLSRRQDDLPSEVWPGLFVGGVRASLNKGGLEKLGIKSVLGLCQWEPPYPDSFTYMMVDVDDRPFVDVVSYFSHANVFIQESLSKGGVLVHCYQGVSRSATFAAAYLMCSEGFSPLEALDKMREARPSVQPNTGFFRQLKLYDGIGRPLFTKDTQLLRLKLDYFKRHFDEGNSVPMLALKVRQLKNASIRLFKDGKAFSISLKGARALSCGQCDTFLLRMNSVLPHKCGKDDCPYMIVEPLIWMEVGNQEGDLQCPDCHTALGAWSWLEKDTPCGVTLEPLFYLDKRLFTDKGDGPQKPE